jgi:Protein of unknown function (DUF3892)
MSVQIRCINKSDRPNPHERIINIGGVNPDGARWKRSQQQAILDIESGTYDYYVSVAGRTVAVVVAKSQWGHKYIKTTADGEHPNNLLSLPECP